MQRKLFVIYNPKSGNHRNTIQAVRALRSFAEANDLPCETFETVEKGGAKAVVNSRFENDFTDLVIIGGDGTMNEAVNGLAVDVPVTLIPAGTGNDTVKNLPIGKNIDEQLAVLIRNTTVKMDLGVCNGRKFLNGVGIGFDGQIVEDMAERKVPLLTGHAKYYYHVLSILASYKEKPFEFSLNEQKIADSLILMTIGNGTTFGGGFKLMPQAKIDDGLLEICTIGKLPGWKRFLNIHRLSNGTHDRLSAVTFYRSSQVTVEENPFVYAHIDGERMGRPPFSISVLPLALSVRV